MLKPYQMIGSEGFESTLHNLIALIHRDHIGSVVFDCKFIQPAYTTAPSHQCYLYVLKQDCADNAVASDNAISLGAINWVAVECLQRWGYWNRDKFEKDWLTEELHDRRIHRQHYIYTSDGCGYAVSFVSEVIAINADKFEIRQSAHLIG
jgi:hypothetical protein